MKKITLLLVLLTTLGVPSVTYSEQKTLEVKFYANDIGKVTSNPPGIDCEKEPCSKEFDADSTVTLTATPKNFTGNHFVMWEIVTTTTVRNPYGASSTTNTERKTSKTLSLNLANYGVHSDYINESFYVKAIFKIERCYGAVGPGCGLFFGDDSFDSSKKEYKVAYSDPDSDIAVGSILHDQCCVDNPLGHNCPYFGYDNPDSCRKEWQKAKDNKMDFLTWKPTDENDQSIPFGGKNGYPANTGDPLSILSSLPASLPDYLKAPDGTKLDPNPPEQPYKDSDYCKSGEFCYTDEESREMGYGICGPKLGSLSLIANPISGKARLTVNLEASLSQKSTDDSRYSYSWTAVYAEERCYTPPGGGITNCYHPSYASAEGQKTSITFDKEDKYIIELTVKDKKSGCFRKQTQEITVEKKEEEPKPPNKANSWGDTHLCTFDNLAYDFQAVGEFIFVKSTVSNDSFEVQVRQLPWGTRTDVSVNKAVAMNVSGDKVGFYSGKTPICYVNGSPQELTDGNNFALPKGGIINKKGQTYAVTSQNQSASVEISEFSWGLLINVYVSDSYKNQVIGLMGNLDGNSKNDIATRSGVSLGTDLKFDVLYPGYADSWRISQNESLFYYAAGETTATFTDLNFPRKPAKVSDLSAEDRAKAEQICREAGITNQILLENCILDVGVTGDKTFAQIPADLADPQTAVTVTDTSTDSNSDGEGVDTTQCFISTVAGGN